MLTSEHISEVCNFSTGVLCRQQERIPGRCGEGCRSVQDPQSFRPEQEPARSSRWEQQVCRDPQTRKLYLIFRLGFTKAVVSSFSNQLPQAWVPLLNKVIPWITILPWYILCYVFFNLVLFRWLNEGMLTSIVDLICLQTANLTLLRLRWSKFAKQVPMCNSWLVQVKGGKKLEAEIKCALEDGWQDWRRHHWNLWLSAGQA